MNMNQETNTINWMAALTARLLVGPMLRRAAMTLLLAVLTTATWADEDGVWKYLPNSTNSACIITGYNGPSGDDITTITIPKALADMPVVSINAGVFSAFEFLRTFVFYEDAQIQYMPDIPNLMFFSGVNLINDSGETVAENTLPASITTLGNEFRGTAIRTLTMPGVTSVGDYAFEGCNVLTSLTFGKAAAIGTYAFQKIKSFSYTSNGYPEYFITTITYPGPMANWSCYNFQYSPNLVVNCSDGKCGWCGDAWSSSRPFYKDGSCLYWTLDNSGNMVIDCVQNDDVYEDLSKQVIKTKNWQNEWEYADDVTSLTLNHVYALNKDEFNWSKKLTSVTFTEGLTSIGESAFFKCPITSLTIPSTVTSIGPKAFADCNDIATIVVNGNNSTYDSRGNCNAIIETNTNTLVVGCKSTSVPASVTSIGDHAFSGIKSLPAVTLPAGLTSIGEDAFYYCEGLTTVTIPASVTSIGKSAFDECHNLSQLYYDGSKAQWNQVTKGYWWNSNVSSSYTEHWRCTVTFDANGHGTAPAAQTGLWSGEGKATEPAPMTADGYACTGWYKDAACTQPWDFANDVVPDDMTLYAYWEPLCSATFTTAETEVEIPYGQEWTDIPVTVNSLYFGWFLNESGTFRVADAVAVVPYRGDATSYISLVSSAGMIDAYKGAGEHSVGNRLSEPLTDEGQSGTLWVYIPKERWDAAAAGEYSQFLYYDAVFLYNGVTPAETYTYSLGYDEKVTLRLSVPEAVTLTFDANGGSDAMAVANGRAGIRMTLPDCTYTAPESQSFLCWNTEVDGSGTRYYAGQEYIFYASTTLYAEWGGECVIDLTTATEQEITLGLSGQLTQLNGYFVSDADGMGLDVDLDGVKDVEIAQEIDEKTDVMTASVKKLTSPTQNYRFVLTVSGEEGEYGSVTFKFVNEGATVEQSAVELLYDNNGTYNREHLLELNDGQLHHLMLSERTLYRDGYWNTLCLPFDLATLTGTPLDGATVMELDTETAYEGHVTGLEGTTLYLNFKAATSIEAGKPYIVKWATPAANIVNPVFRSVIVTAQAKDVPNPYRYTYEDPEYITVAVPGSVSFTGGKFCGTYDPTDIYDDEHDKFYLGNNNKLYWPETDGYSVKAFRAYFDLSPAAAGVREFHLSFGEDDATGIVSTTNLTNYTNSAGAGWYDLSGRKLQGKPTKKGLYINNGRKVVIK